MDNYFQVLLEYQETDDWRIERMAYNYRRIAFMNSKRRGNVYLFKGDGFYKIGASEDVPRRATEIDRGIPLLLDIVHYFNSDEMFDAEKGLHSKFADKIVKGEWFLLDDNDVEFIKSITRYEDDCYYLSDNRVLYIDVVALY